MIATSSTRAEQPQPSGGGLTGCGCPARPEGPGRPHLITVINDGSVLRMDDDGPLSRLRSQRLLSPHPDTRMECLHVYSMHDVRWAMEQSEYGGEGVYVANGVDPDEQPRAPSVFGAGGGHDLLLGQDETFKRHRECCQINAVGNNSGKWPTRSDLQNTALTAFNRAMYHHTHQGLHPFETACYSYYTPYPNHSSSHHQCYNIRLLSRNIPWRSTRSHQLRHYPS